MPSTSHPPTPPPPHHEPSTPPRARVLILGVDAVRAALPATAVQLTHACIAAGFDSVVPASWGDELVAAGYLDELAQRDGRPAICCSCPLVAARLASHVGAPAHALIRLVPPPVAAARYLRLMAGQSPVHVTYAGGCPVDGDPAIDERLSPHELLAAIAARGVSVAGQPAAYDGTLPPDRRRHLSLPGGVPSPGALAARALPYRLLEVSGEDYATELAERLLGGESLLLDVAPQLGCSCSGMSPGTVAAGARQLAAALEPPRSPTPVVDPALRVEVRAEARRNDGGEGGGASREVDGEAGGGADAAATAAAAVAGRPGGTATSAAPRGGVSVTRRTPIVLPRVWAGAFPRTRVGDGRLLPRAYVARRQSQGALATVPPPSSSPPPLPVAGEREGGRLERERQERERQELGGPGFSTLVAGLRVVIADSVPRAAGAARGGAADWRSRLDAAIARWEARGYDTEVLRRARALPAPPDVDGLLHTFSAAVDRLRELEGLVAAVRPSLKGAPIFRDPTTVRTAEELVEEILSVP